MPPRKTTASGSVPIEAFKHDDKRINNPTADSGELLSPDVAQPNKLRYPRNPDLDPQLVWTGKDEQDGEDLVVDAPPIYIQEKIVPRAIIENLRKVVEKPELTLFDDFDGLEGYEAVEYYQHEANWSNRMILGDSLQVMASLAEKENLRGKVQMIYVDPPYGIRFGSNWQTRTDKRDVRDAKVEDVTREVEVVKAFRDTWELGIHSYLAYLRDRLRMSLELLTQSGSVFVQIGDENVHLVRSLLDEVFGSENFVSLISFTTTSGFESSTLARAGDYLLWYAKSLSDLKVNQIWLPNEKAASSGYRWIRLLDGTYRGLTKAELAGEVVPPKGARLYTPDNLQSQNPASVDQAFEYQGKIYRPGTNSHWKASFPDGMNRLAWANRIHVAKNSIRYVRYADDFRYRPATNMWTDTGTGNFTDDKVYVVQTNTKVIERCILMSTDPGDLVIDPTCGSGTTALMAERTGRRWITIDTSRVSLALARQRIMAGQFPYYVLADSTNLHKGFVYGRAPHIKIESIANNPEIKPGMTQEEIDQAIMDHADVELLCDQPEENGKIVRVSGPFTVESLSPHATVTLVRSGSDETATVDDASAFEKSIIDNLFKAGVQNGRKSERLLFDSLVPFAGERIQGQGIQKDNGDRVAVSIGPRYGTVDPEWIRLAARESTRGFGFDLLLVCAFSFDPLAGRTVEEFSIGKVRVLLVNMNRDLAMGDVLLKKTGSGNLFTVFGEPDIAISRDGDEMTVAIKGVDVYNPTTGEIRSDSTDGIALWMIDTDYNGESFFVRQCYFTGDNDPYKRLKAVLKADIDQDAWEMLHKTKSQPFKRPEKGKIAVKVINHYGDEVLQVYDV